MDRDLLICNCNSVEHQIVFTHEHEDNIVYATVHLNSLPFFKRLVVGIRYIFGRKSRYGAWEEFVFDDTHIPQLKDTIKTLEAATFH